MIIHLHIQYPLLGKPEPFLLGKFQLLHKSVDSIEKKLSGSIGSLTLRCKDFQIYQLEIPSAEDCLNIASSVEQLSNIGRSSFTEQLLALVYSCVLGQRFEWSKTHYLVIFYTFQIT